MNSDDGDDDDDATSQIPHTKQEVKGGAGRLVWEKVPWGGEERGERVCGQNEKGERA